MSLADLWGSLSDHRYVYLTLAGVVVLVAVRSERPALTELIAATGGARRLRFTKALRLAHRATLARDVVPVRQESGG